MAQVIGIGKQEINKITGAVKPAAPLPTIKDVVEIKEEEVKEEKPKRGRKKKTEEV